MIRAGGYENKNLAAEFEPLYVDSYVVKTDAFRAAYVIYGGAKLIRVVVLRDETTYYEFADVAEEDAKIYDEEWEGKAPLPVSDVKEYARAVGMCFSKRSFARRSRGIWEDGTVGRPRGDWGQR